jgi:hypothetical protein
MLSGRLPRLPPARLASQRSLPPSDDPPRQRPSLLPAPHQTENLLIAKKDIRSFWREDQPDRDKENSSLPKGECFQSEARRGLRVATDEKEGRRVTHNFILRKRRPTHISKIIDKVISQGIEPWHENSTKRLPPISKREQHLQELANWPGSNEEDEVFQRWQH